MNGTNSFTQGLSGVMKPWENGDYDRALERLEKLREAWPGNARLLVWWAHLVQLQDEPTHDLNAAKRALQQAVELDTHAPVAAIELGHFLDNVKDDPQAATKAFAQAITAARLALIDGLLGQAKTLLQLDRREDAIRCLVEAHRLADAEASTKKARFASRIEELFKELGQMQSV